MGDPGVVPGQTGVGPSGAAHDAALVVEMLSGLALLRSETSAEWWFANRSPNIWYCIWTIAARNAEINEKSQADRVPIRAPPEGGL